MDGFSTIAKNVIRKKQEELEEIPPVLLKHEYFAETEKVAEAAVEKDHQQRLVEFKQQLENMKIKYSGFLKCYAPEVEILRKRFDLRDFQFRFQQQEDLAQFSRVLSGEGIWEDVAIPDYRGPVGRWTGFYRKSFSLKARGNPDNRLFLCFKAVDYIARVYINGIFTGSHQGFFSAFEFDITDNVIFDSDNTLVVEVQNDYPMLGIASWSNRREDGNKIYAATGPGWDDPELGWHHCPPGGGIFDSVYLEERNRLFVSDLFVRPDIDRGNAEVWLEVFNTGDVNVHLAAGISIIPGNFVGETIETAVPPEEAGPGVNYYRFTVSMPEFRLWTPEEPWLYIARASVLEGESLIKDQKECSFGMRKFHMDTKKIPKGTLYLNNEPVILRGANEMGHLQQCVMRNDLDQVIEDILIARLANLNFIRFTQRPVQEEIYHYCDMLGMMNQTDLPVFGYLRRNQFCEALRQCSEMERHIRRHPSAIMVTYMNERFNLEVHKKGHRHMLKQETEDFFAAADIVIRQENPDRVVKHVEGDYHPPTAEGLADFHCYCMWYTNHYLPAGKLVRGYLPDIRKGWKAGCGEYGAEGLDNLEVMLERYPVDWLPEKPEDPWMPDRIIMSQTFMMHGDWYEEQRRIHDWIRESQAFQALAVKLMTDALRRRSDRVVSTAVHLLIDAWPAGWMKALVDCKRTPKPAYFALGAACEPVRVNLRIDRLTAYSGDRLDIEAWILNDTASKLRGLTVVASIRLGETVWRSFCIDSKAAPVLPTYAGTVSFAAPFVSGRETVYIDACLFGAGGEVINKERLAIEVFEKVNISDRLSIAVMGQEAWELAQKLEIKAEHVTAFQERPSFALISSYDGFIALSDIIMDWISQGTAAVFLLDRMAEENLRFADINVHTIKMNGLTFLSASKSDPLTRDFKSGDFSFWYNEEQGHIGFIAEKYFICEGMEPVLYTYDKNPGNRDSSGGKGKLAVMGALSYGKGKIVLSTLSTKGCINVNPVSDILWQRLLSLNSLEM